MDIMREWKEYRFSDFVDINPTVKLSKEEKISFVEMKDLNDGKRYCCPSREKELSGGSKFNEGDTLFARITPCLENGKICQVKGLKNDQGFGSTEFLVFRGKTQISDSDFIYYLSRWDDVRSHAEINLDGTSGRQRVPKEAFNDLTLLLPSLPEQKVIASVLSSLDDKIDLLHRQNATLEKMAETLFRQWFVEEVKEEWKMGQLSDEFDFTMGASPPGESYNEDAIGTPMYQGNTDFGFRFPTNRVFTTDPKKFAEKYDTLISVRAPVGEQNMANEKCCIGRGIAAFRYKKDKSFYSYTYYKLMSLMEEIKQFNETGTVFGAISKTDFESIEIMIPDNKSIVEFQNTTRNIDLKIQTNTEQIHTLTSLRDTLLPKLMSNEVKLTYE
ncbi:restriction endonuclease subunit S [Proteiniphilum sp.]|uniref:restriction endonuclease subunit S n=1 Tax=Proteiniphilum sp. TaxID=1926877 RepID=UPI00331F416A